MPINLPSDTRFDTRGLPEGYDPRKLYEYRLKTLIETGTGLESFLAKYISPDILNSVAFAIDPTYQFKVSPSTITPSNRDRWRQTASVLQVQKRRRRYTRQTSARLSNYNGVSACFSPYEFEDAPISTVFDSSLPSQAALAEYSKDTTSRTRLIGSTQGTLEMFRGTLNSPSRRVTKRNSERTFTSATSPSPQCSAVGGAAGWTSRKEEMFSDEFIPNGSRLSLTTYNNLKTAEISYAKALCQKHAISMLKDWSPEKRSFSFFRSLVELRDLPRSIASMKTSIEHFYKLYYSLPVNSTLRRKIFDLSATARDIPSEYLSFHFGWKQLYKDIRDLLDLPEKMSKKFNFLAHRNGKPTTFRVTRDFPSAQTGVSGFDYESSDYDHTRTYDSRLERNSQVRLVINALFDFPTINTPQFSDSLYRQLTGVTPRFTDVYNLIPWTWLLDWFTGIGNYVELIDQINHDHSLVNWGMISCRTTGSLVTDFTSKSNMSSWVSDGITGVSTLTLVTNRHTSRFDYVCHTRSDIATILDVRLTSVPTSLSDYQKSILGALLLSRTSATRSEAFRPRS